MRDYDIVVYGASGFTGERVVGWIKHIEHDLKKPLRWALAGRSHAKLDQVLEKYHVKKETIVADVADTEALLKMCRRATVLINCVGPFRFYGEPVVKACVEAGTHYLDICGETQFIEQIIMTYHKQAKAKNIVVVPACGFDSLPTELGKLESQRVLEKNGITPHSIEMFFRIHVGPSGTVGHYATYQSAVEGFSSLNELKTFRRKTFQKSIYPSLPPPKLHVNSRVHWENRIGGYVVPFMFADPAVVRLSSYLIAEGRGEGVAPVHFAAFAVIPTFWNVVKAAIGLSLFNILIRFSFGKSLLLKYPKFFSFGLFSHEGPSEEQLKGTSFSTTFYAHGFSKSGLPKPDKTAVLKVSGPEIGYVTTPICIVACALTILKESDKIVPGALTPSVAFGGTSLVERLKKDGISFSVIEKP